MNYYILLDELHFPPLIIFDLRERVVESSLPTAHRTGYELLFQPGIMSVIDFLFKKLIKTTTKKEPLFGGNNLKEDQNLR